MSLTTDRTETGVCLRVVESENDPRRNSDPKELTSAHTCAYTHMYVRASAHTHVNVHTAYVYMCVCVCMYAYTHTCVTHGCEHMFTTGQTETTVYRQQTPPTGAASSCFLDTEALCSQFREVRGYEHNELWLTPCRF